MSITSPDPRISTYNPVVATTEFAAMFPVFDNDDIAVYHDGVERTDFTISATYITGVSVNAKAVFAVGITGKVEVVGAREPRRTSEFNPGAPLPTRDQNLALNTIVSEIQEARRDIDRSFKAPYGTTPPAVPLPAQEKVIGWDENGNLVNIDPAEFVNDAGFATAAQGSKADTALQPGAADSNTNFLQAGTGAVARASRNKSRDVINVLDFGATGLGTGNDGPAIQLAIDALKAIPGNTRPTLVFGNEGGARRQFRVTSTLNFTQMRDLGLIVDLNGSVLIGATAGQPVIDALDSEHILFCNGSIYGDPSSAPNYGIQIGRGITGRGAAYINMRRLNFTGEFASACMLNSASEISEFDKCNFWNARTAAGNACVIQDARRVVAVTSQFFTVTQPNNTYVSHNDNIFTNCTFEKISGENPATGYAIKIYGRSNAHVFKNCYAQNEYGSALYLNGDHAMLEFDCHCEAANIKSNVVVDTSVGTSLLRSCQFPEYFMFCTEALIKGEGGSGNVFFMSSKVDVSDTNTSAPLFKTNGATFRFHGEISVGFAVSDGTYNLSALAALNGVVKCSNVPTVLTLPTTGAYSVVPFNSIEQRNYGLQRMMGSFAIDPSGVSIASAATITLPLGQGNSFYITGTTTISKINVASTDRGRLVQLIFGGAITLQNSYANKLLLASNFAAAANNTIWLLCDGTVWAEVTRCANVVV